jgi:hypothetical protein
MLKNILKLEGAQKLTMGEQKSIKGGKLVPVCEDFKALGYYPISQAACGAGYVFESNYYGNGKSTCCIDNRAW